MSTRDAADGTGTGTGSAEAISRWLLLMSNALGVIGVALLLQSAFIGAELAQSAMLTLLVGSCAFAASLLLINQRYRMPAGRAPGQNTRTDLAYAALAAAVAMGFMLVTGNADQRALPLALGCALLVWLVGSAISLLERLGAPLALAASVVMTIVVAASAAPLWLAPLSELARSSLLVDAVLAVSPLTLLAALADFDYLRTGWFYQHSALGALRYTYPPDWALIAAYALLPTAAVLTARGRPAAGRPRASTTKA
jgi:hypothetical protein